MKDNKDGVRLIPADALSQMIESGSTDDMLIIDAREPSGYESLHVRKAINVPMPLLTPRSGEQFCAMHLEGAIDDFRTSNAFRGREGKHVVVYDDGDGEGDDSSSALCLRRLLVEEGMVSEVSIVKGGISAIRNACPDIVEHGAKRKGRRPMMQMLKNPLDDPPSPVIEGFLYIGTITNAENSAHLNDSGITHVITLGPDPVEAAVPKSNYMHLGLRDTSEDDLRPHVDKALSFVERMEEGQRLLIHCKMGVSRSPAVSAAVLMRHKGMGLMESLQLIKKARPAASPNKGFLLQLISMEQEWTGQTTLDADHPMVKGAQTA